MKYTVEDFYSKKFEDESNEILLNERWLFSEKAMEDYVIQITNISISDYISYCENLPSIPNYTSKDITQLSSLYDCTLGMCKALKEVDHGLSFTEIATKLHDGQYYKYNSGALTKYGENQVKTASQLGLTICIKDLWYLSSIGHIFPNLAGDIQNKYFSICLLRDPFYSRVLCSMYKQETNLPNYMTILSETTQKRRLSSCKQLINFFIQQCNTESISIYPITTNFN